MTQLRIAALLAALAVAVAACGADEAAQEATDGTDTPAETPAETTPSPTATETAEPTATAEEIASPTEPMATATDGGTEAATAADAATVATADSDLGDILVDAEGFTLYLFTQDTEGASTCTGGCAETWPPLEASGEPEPGEGVDASLLGTIERDDGTMQVTYNGHPLYTYAPDTEPGDVTGQGVGDVWFAVTPEGEAAGEESAAAAGGNAGGY